MVSVYVTTSSSRRHIAAALAEYRALKRKHPDDAILDGTLRQIRAELRERRRRNRAMSVPVKAGWMSDAAFAAMLERYANLGYVDRELVPA